ncbi:hypothetical protein [Haloarcula japonica]|uniref:Uncharacterized protein n=1 Tax=Haloarcula japonica (strain ATCC 49778 / DSM 6131 / JCM 7785 / NBRC 101032 / NCIMB 13157 / TR-1) TaxID=1227453 RepID=M0LGK3_HALJT|nr:hypothetical protein [Haloarcula japonica]EMA32757.1 hypothetical protein C444_06031 [Haloarcula japonica DSM 6131]
MTTNRLKITYGQREKTQRAVRERLRRADAGEEFDEQEPAFILNFEELDDVERLMRRLNLQLLDVTASERPEIFVRRLDSSNAIIKRFTGISRNSKRSVSLSSQQTAIANARSSVRGPEAIDLSIPLQSTPTHQTLLLQGTSA